MQKSGATLPVAHGVPEQPRVSTGSRVDLFGVQIDVVRMEEAVQRVLSWVYQPLGACRYVVTPNVDHAVLLQDHQGSARSLRSCRPRPAGWLSRGLGLTPVGQDPAGACRRFGSGAGICSQPAIRTGRSAHSFWGRVRASPIVRQIVSGNAMAAASTLSIPTARPSASRKDDVEQARILERIRKG